MLGLIFLQKILCLHSRLLLLNRHQTSPHSSLPQWPKILIKLPPKRFSALQAVQSSFSTLLACWPGDARCTWSTWRKASVSADRLDRRIWRNDASGYLWTYQGLADDFRCLQEKGAFQGVNCEHYLHYWSKKSSVLVNAFKNDKERSYKYF